MRRFLTSCVVSAAFITTAVAAVPVAKLTDVAGPVLVDHGKGFVRVSTSTELSPGSRILVSKGGAATLAYSEGCELALVANSITTVAAADGCKAGEQVAAQGLVAGGLAGGGLTGGVIAGVAFTGAAIGIGTAVGIRASRNANRDRPILGVSP
jgi:hypothetical protein